MERGPVLATQRVRWAENSLQRSWATCWDAWDEENSVAMGKFGKGHNTNKKKKVSANTLKVYTFAAAAADKKLAAAELAFDSDPSEENKAAVQQARAKACAASAKLGRSAGAALAAEEGGKGKASIASEAEVEESS